MSVKIDGDNKDLNCCIFRHAIYKDTYKSLNPHANKKICDRLFKEKKIFGCGKPFKFIKGEPNKIEICRYI
jgi:hypothetical protein